MVGGRFAVKDNLATFVDLVPDIAAPAVTDRDDAVNALTRRAIM